jgi:hypothetical protein
VTSALERRAVLGAILADRPELHALHGEGRDGPIGLWAADVGTYELIADLTEPGSRTFETGLGLSTALFVALGADHTCAVWGEEEAKRLVDYCESRGHSTDRLTLVPGDSTRTLPGLVLGDLDVVLIDGGHGFPTPIVDFHYSAHQLRVGGSLVIDDVGLPAVRMLVRYLDADPRWERTHRTRKWVAYCLVARSDQPEDWWAQPWLRLAPGLRFANWRGHQRWRLGRLARRAGLRRDRPSP